MLGVQWIVLVAMLSACKGKELNDTATGAVNKDRGLILDYLIAKKGLSCACGRTNRESRLTGGGELSRIHEFPWLADIITEEDQAGPGALINDRFVITAATHLNGLTPYDVKVRLGVHDRCTVEKSSIVMSVGDVRIHENYDLETKANDVALLKLGSPVVFQRNILPICIPNPSSSYRGQVATIVSWGSDDTDEDEEDEDDEEEKKKKKQKLKKKKQSKRTETVIRNKRQDDNEEDEDEDEDDEDGVNCRPMKVGLPVLGAQQCDTVEDYTSDKGCVGIINAPSIVCERDAGGPVQFRNHHGVYEIIGVLAASNDCEDSKMPALYTRLTGEYVRWIEYHTRDALYCAL